MCQTVISVVGRKIQAGKEARLSRVEAAVLSRGWRGSGGRWGRASRAFLRTLNVGLNEMEPQRVQESEGPDVRPAACRISAAARSQGAAGDVIRESPEEGW